ncbi:MAG: chemotaxis protein CheD, partial [Cyclobacteriaceae bacterium]|nr:chemotaxis protein CheD [Cyclobacteriaceae bacterium]
MTNNNCQNKYLYPSAIIVSERPTIIKTVLGSCVSVCMYDKEKKIGGINHFMLPFWRGNELSSPKYGNVAMGRLLEKMLHIGANKESIIAKVFGGASLLNIQSDHYRIG